MSRRLVPQQHNISQMTSFGQSSDSSSSIARSLAMFHNRVPPGIVFVAAWALCLAISSVDLPAAEQRPNVVVFLADDLGYSDLGCYGGDIQTPNLDTLAKNGLRFTQFYNTARCWPTRGALLTGYYAQQIRRDTVPGVRSGGQGVRPTWARLLPEMLKPLGYRSYHCGKWHVDGKALD